MTSFNPASVWFPDRLPPDPAAEAELAARTREQEVQGLLRERQQVLARREAVADQKPEPEMIVVNALGEDTGLRVQRVSSGLARERIEDELRELDAGLAAIDRELAHRNADAEYDRQEAIQQQLADLNAPD